MTSTIDTPILDRMLEPITNILTPSVAKGIAEMRADPRLQARLDELAAKSSQGRLSQAEHAEYAEYVDAIDLIGILQAKALAVLARSSTGS